MLLELIIDVTERNSLKVMVLDTENRCYLEMPLSVRIVFDPLEPLLLRAAE